MRKLLMVFSLLISFQLSAQQVKKGVTGSNGVYIGFWEYKPADYNPGVKYPVIIFLHGIGERGNGTTDLGNLTNIALPRMIANGNPMRFYWNGKWETFLVLSPQLSYNYGEWQNFYVDEMIKHATTTLSGDPNRIFLTGLSLGGGGVWRYASASSANAARLAAIAPICPTCQPPYWENIAKNNLPVWAFHAIDDGVVGWPCTDNAVNAINAYNPIVKAKRTIWPDGNHWIWDRAYDPQYSWQNPNLYEWFLGQEKFNPANVKPVANAGADITISATVGSVTLNGSASSDADGAINRYVWTKVSGPWGGTITSPMNAKTTVTGLTTEGVYEFELKVADRKAETAVDRVKVTVTPGGGTTPPPTTPPPPTGTNQKPVSNAGTDITITLPANSTTLNGGGSKDPDGSIIKYEWTKTSGPAGSTLESVNSASTKLNNLTSGTYIFNLRVWDNLWEPSDDQVTVIVKSATTTTPPPPTGTNKAPVANAGADATITLPTNTVNLTGSKSSDPDGSIIKYEWRYVSGPGQSKISTPTAANTSVTNLAEGTYTFALKVWDNLWEPGEDQVVIVVNGTKVPLPPSGTNVAPVSKAGNDISLTLPVNKTILTGSGSYDPDGTIIKYEWKYVSGPAQYKIENIHTANTAISNLVQGKYTFALRIWDNLWEPHEDQIVVNVVSGTTTTPPTTVNRAPVAKAGNDLSIILPVNSVTLSGFASYDADGSIIKYEWRKVSGPAATIKNINSANTTVTGLTQGAYTFALRVWDNLWEPNEDLVVVNVAGSTTLITPPPSGNKAPVANAGSDATITLPANGYALNGAGSYDPDGTVGKYEWRKESGPAQFNISDINGVSPYVSNLVAGTYVFVLRIWDNLWEPHEDKVIITVKGSASVANTTVVSEPSASFVQQKLVVSPNPAKNIINVSMGSADLGTAVMNIYDVSGKLVKNTIANAPSGYRQQMEISSLIPGAYTLEVVGDNREKAVTRFIKQ